MTSVFHCLPLVKRWLRPDDCRRLSRWDMQTVSTHSTINESTLTASISRRTWALLPSSLTFGKETPKETRLLLLAIYIQVFVVVYLAWSEFASLFGSAAGGGGLLALIRSVKIVNAWRSGSFIMSGNQEEVCDALCLAKLRKSGCVVLT